MRDGFFPLYRKFFDHWLWSEEREYSKAEAWIDMLSSCAVAPAKRIIQGIVVPVKRGEIVASERFFAARWKWSRTKVRHFISLLEADGMIKPRKDQGSTILTLVNYERYSLRLSEKEPQKNHRETTEEPPEDQIGERKEVQSKREYPRDVSEVIKHGSTLYPTPDETFCLWWFDQMEGSGWVDRERRAVSNWKAAFSAAWRGAQHKEHEKVHFRRQRNATNPQAGRGSAAGAINPGRTTASQYRD